MSIVTNFQSFPHYREFQGEETQRSWPQLSDGRYCFEHPNQEGYKYTDIGDKRAIPVGGLCLITRLPYFSSCSFVFLLSLWEIGNLDFIYIAQDDVRSPLAVLSHLIVRWVVYMSPTRMEFLHGMVYSTHPTSRGC